MNKKENIMVNTQLFQTLKGALLPAATVRNAEQAPAYAFSPRHQLAQLAATGCLSQTFYTSADDQLDKVMALAKEVDASFVANDIQPTVTTQAADRQDIMNVGGFSDAVFTMVAAFAEGRMAADHWVGEIEKIALEAQ